MESVCLSDAYVEMYSRAGRCVNTRCEVTVTARTGEASVCLTITVQTDVTTSV